jgi:hypothetical protein
MATEIAQFADQAVPMLCLALLLIGFIFMHMRLRSLASYTLIASFTSLAAVILARSWLGELYMRFSVPDSHEQNSGTLAAISQFETIYILSISVLAITFCVAFCLSARSIPGPN